MIDFRRIALVADVGSPAACETYDKIMGQYPFLKEREIVAGNVDIIVALGGDGLMLKILHRYMDCGAKFYGINRGSIGFLMNPYNSEANILECLENATLCKLSPLEMEVENIHGEKITQLAINEVSLLRETNQSCRIKIFLDEQPRLNMLVCDGIMVATPAGSTAYNFAADGPILPLNANLLCLTPIAPFRPRRWKGALIGNKTKIRFENIDPYKRPMSVAADFHEFREIIWANVCSRDDKEISLLFDKDNNIEDRLLKEMFIP